MEDFHVMLLPSGRGGKIPPGTVCAGVNVNGEFSVQALSIAIISELIKVTLVVLVSCKERVTFS